jgi:hypothetical protein
MQAQAGVPKRLVVFGARPDHPAANVARSALSVGLAVRLSPLDFFFLLIVELGWVDSCSDRRRSGFKSVVTLALDR